MAMTTGFESLKKTGFLGLLAAWAVTAMPGSETAAQTKDAVTFSKHIAPILQSRLRTHRSDHRGRGIRGHFTAARLRSSGGGKHRAGGARRKGLSGTFVQWTRCTEFWIT